MAATKLMLVSVLMLLDNAILKNANSEVKKKKLYKKKVML